MHDVELHDGPHIVLKKLAQDYDPSDRINAIRLVEESRAAGHLLTGLLNVDESMADFASTEKRPERPLRDLTDADLRLGRDQFQALMAEFA